MRLTLNRGVLTVETTTEEAPLPEVLEALKAAGLLVEVRQPETRPEVAPEETGGVVIPMTRRAAQ